MAPVPPFAALAASPAPALDQLALALAVELRPPGSVDTALVIGALDALGAELGAVTASLEPGDVVGQTQALTALLGVAHGFSGDREDYDHPDHSMLDLVLERRRGLPILLSVVYTEVARRAEIPLAGVGLPGHFVVGHFAADPPVLLDPFGGGGRLGPIGGPDVRPWTPTEVAMRMLNNLVGAYRMRRDLPRAIQCAELRLHLPSGGDMRKTLAAELRSMQARMN
ncbi:transglutaminase-like domain-containing protein [Paraconexibacter sp. AEG42_29]